MKIDDVPQDEGSHYGDMLRVTYAVGEDGRYQSVQTKGWRGEIDATDVAVGLADRRIQATWRRVRAGDLSPLAYHMEMARMSPTLLAADMGIWRWRVKRHLRPAVFALLSPVMLARYAEAMGIDLQTLRSVPDQPEAL